jgi:hypothetical protein
VAGAERRGGHDPFWDLEGVGVRRRRTRRRIVSVVAFLAALTACFGAAALWAVELGLVAAIGPAA